MNEGDESPIEHVSLDPEIIAKLDMSKFDGKCG